MSLNTRSLFMYWQRSVKALAVAKSRNSRYIHSRKTQCWLYCGQGNIAHSGRVEECRNVSFLPKRTTLLSSSNIISHPPWPTLCSNWNGRQNKTNDHCSLGRILFCKFLKTADDFYWILTIIGRIEMAILVSAFSGTQSLVLVVVNVVNVVLVIVLVYRRALLPGRPGRRNVNWSNQLISCRGKKSRL